jgi:hypothetical protein
MQAQIRAIFRAHHTPRLKAFVVRTDEKLTAFVDVELAIREASVKISFLQNRA